MKKIKTFIVLVLAMQTLMSNGQELKKNIIEPFQKEALLREKVFIHLNKTSYLANETIWFTAYVGEDASNTPSMFTSNLQVNLLNDEGAVLATKMIFIKDGVGFGEFNTNSSFDSGSYFIQATTNFMKNFGNENVFMQEIKVINSDSKKEIVSKEKTNKYDLQVFPESGYLLENAENSIGIKALINGKGYPFDGTIVNSNGTVVSNYKGNIFGMSVTSFYYKQDETYTAIITINENTKKITIPKAQKEGLIFSIDNTDSQTLKLTIHTNKLSLSKLKQDKLALLIYRNNYICQALNLSFTGQNQTSQDLYFDKKNFLDGVNVITLFKNNQPIAERKFFVEKPDKKTSIQIEESFSVTDSIQYKIKTLDASFNPIPTQLSISVLPKNTHLFTEKQNIKAAFLLSPYVKGFIENPAYYFKNKHPKEKEFLDVLLLNQGWTAYSLKDKILEINPPKKYDSEYGFRLNGNILRHPKTYDIGLLSKKNRITAFSTIDKQQHFSFENIFAYKNDTARVALIKPNKSLLKPSKVSFIEESLQTTNYDYLTSNYNYSNLLERSKGQSSKAIEKEVKAFAEQSKVENIDEVRLKNIKLKKEETNYEKELNIAAKRKVLAASFYRNTKITEDIERSNRTLYDYFASIGIAKQGILVLKRYQYSPNTFLGSVTPKLFLDDIAVPWDIFTQSYQMSNIDEVLINSSGAGGGVNGMSGIIRIYTKKGDHEYYQEAPKNLYENLVLLTGFDKASAYYQPQYNIHSKETLNWTEIGWQPYLKTDENGEITFKVPTNEFGNEHQVIINGFSVNGLLYHTIYKTGDANF